MGAKNTFFSLRKHADWQGAFLEMERSLLMTCVQTCWCWHVANAVSSSVSLSELDSLLDLLLARLPYLRTYPLMYH